MKIEDLLGIDILSGNRQRNLNSHDVTKSINNDRKAVVIITDPDDVDSLYTNDESDYERENTPLKDVVNPGVEYSDGGQAKWSPPLQQQITIMKDTTGTTTDDPTIEPSPEEKDAIVTARTKSGTHSNSSVDELQRLLKLANISDVNRDNREIEQQEEQLQVINPIFAKNTPF